MKKNIGLIAICFFDLVLVGCAQLHHIQIGEIHGDEGLLTPFEIKVNETGVNLQEGATVAKAVLRDQNARNTVSSIETIIALFQYGPRTGNLVYSDSYADHLAQELRTKCPSGKITGLVSIRETRKYPVISGEIIKIKGYCIMPRKTGV